MNNYPAFKRLNFFTGFFTTADDWNEGQAYHLEKRKLHNRLLHRPGVMQGLDVQPDTVENPGAQPDDGPKVLVKKGAALDSAGNLLVLNRDTQYTIVLPDRLPAWIYLIIEHYEEESDWDQNDQDPDFSGFRRVVERPAIRQRTEEPTDGQVELARIYIESDGQPITLPNPGEQPGSNQIDRRFVVRAGARDDRRDELLDAARSRILQLHHYHLEQQQRQNQGLHTPGILNNVGDELRIVAGEGLSVQVLPGAALDGRGNHLYLDQRQQQRVPEVEESQTLYIAARYDDSFADYLADLSRPFSGRFTTLLVKATDEKPDGVAWLELARIYLTPDTADIVDHDGDGEPAPGAIDLSHRQWSRSLSLASPVLSPALQEQIRTFMEIVREHFAAVARRFPGPAVEDVRHVALSIQMARDTIEYRHLKPRLQVLAGLESEVDRELGAHYPPLTRKPEYIAYQDAVAALLGGFRDGLSPEELLTLEIVVAEAARDLAQVVFPPPHADAGPDLPIVTPSDEAVVSLDASGSTAAEGREIVSYRWEKEQ